MGATKHLFRYLAESVNFSTTQKREGFKIATYSDATWSNIFSNDGKSTYSYIVMPPNGSISFKMGPQSRTVQSSLEAELMIAALTMKEVVFCYNMMVELGLDKRFSSVPLCLDNTIIDISTILSTMYYSVYVGL